MAKQRQASEASWVVSARGERVYAVAHARATIRGDSTVDADLTRLEEQIRSSGSFTVTNVIVNVDAWQETPAGAAAVIPVTGMTEQTVPLVCVSPDDSDVSLQCGFRGSCVSGDGTVTVFAEMIPKDIIHLTILAMFSQDVEKNIEVAGPDVPMIAYYKLPVATKDTLGGVKIGNNIEIADDGTISAKGGSCKHVLSGVACDPPQHVHDEDCMKDLVASTDEVNDALNRALGIDAQPGSEGQTQD